jgi:hypothetical protein
MELLAVLGFFLVLWLVSFSIPTESQKKLEEFEDFDKRNE